jgi:hypothetical protein
MKPIELHDPVRRARVVALLSLAVSVLAAVMAARAWVLEPTVSGRSLSAVVLFLSPLFGAKTGAALWGFVSLMLTFAARFVWRHTPKSPSDRLLW